MKNFIKPLILLCFPILIFTFGCDDYGKYQHCRENPSLGTPMTFQLVDKFGNDALFSDSIHFSDISLTTFDKKNIIYSVDKLNNSEEYLLQISNIDMDFLQYNGKPYLLTYKIRSVDSIYIDAERISNECDMEYSNIKSITRGNESFERVNNRYLITIR
jgi:hypothetical protein